MHKMLKMFLIIFTVLSLSGLFWETQTLASSPFSLINNPGFEDDANSDGIPDGWSANVWTGTGTTSMDSTVKKSGSCSVKIVGTSGDACLGYASADEELVLPNKTFEYSAFVKTESLSQYTSFKVIFKNSGGTVIEEAESEKVSNTGGEWKYISLQIVTPADTATVQFRAILTGTGTVWYDDVNLEQSSVYNLLVNGSAEKDSSDADGKPDNWYEGGFKKIPLSITNPGFEDGMTGPTGWQHMVWDGTLSQDITWTWDNTVSTSGTYSIAVESSLDTAKGGWISSKMPIKEEDTYAYKVYIKTQNVTNKAMMLLTFYDSSNNILKQVEMNAATGTHDWELVTLSYITPSDATRVRLDMRLHGAGKVWFDDVSVERTEWVTDSLYSNQVITSLSITNNGFENGTNGPTGWTQMQWAGTSTKTWDNAVSRSGSYSVAVEGSSAVAQGGWISGKMTVQERDTYVYKVYIKTENVANKALMLLTFYDSSNNILKQVEMNAAAGTHDWEMVTLSCITPLNATQVRLDMRLYGTGKAWFDDVSAEKTEWVIDPSYSSQILTPLSITNPGYEDGTTEPTGWQHMVWDGTLSKDITWTWDNAVSKSGTHSIAVESSLATTHGGWISSKMPVNEEDTYVYKVYVKTANVTDEAFMLLTFYDSGSNILKQVKMNTTTGTHDWELVTLSYMTPLNATQVRLDMRLYGNGKVWFDDVSADKSEWRTAQVAWNTADIFDGSYSLKINSIDASGGVQWSSDDITIIPEAICNYHSYVKTENVSDKVALVFTFKDGKGKVIKEIISDSLSGTVGTWTEISGEAVAPLYAASVRVDLRVFGSGTAWFDAIELNKNSYNRLVNPGAEYSSVSDGATPAGWTKMIWEGSGSQVIHTWDGSVSHTAGKSLRTAINTSTARGGYVSGKYSVDAGKTYKFSVYIKTDNVVDRAILHLEYFDSSGSVIQRVDSSIVSGTTDWTEVALSYTTPSNAVKVRVDVRLFGTGTAWFDDFLFEGPVIIHPSSLYSTSDLSVIRAKIDNDPLILGKYNSQKTLSDKYTLADLDSIETNIMPWKDNVYIYIVPAGATKARLEVLLRGVGTVWLDYARVTHATVGIVEEIQNYSFENGSVSPDSWSKIVLSGNPDMTWDNTNAGEGAKSVKISNSSTSDIGGWLGTFDIPVVAGDKYTSKIRIREDQLLEDGVYINMVFMDDGGTVIGEMLSPVFNRLTAPTWMTVMPGIHYDADVYLKENDTLYAEKALKKLLYSLDDMISGMRYKMLNDGADPDNAYGAFGTGRGLAGAAILYDMIKDSGVISEYEDAEIRSKLAWIANTLMDSNYYNYEDYASSKRNWNTERLCGVGIFSMIFPEYTRSSDWLEYTKDWIDWQLDNVVLDDGAWPESDRYQGAVMRSLITYGKIQKKYNGTDIFSNPKFKSMFEFFVKIQTPVDLANTLTPNVAVLPGVGDSSWSNEWTSVLGWAAPEYASSDTSLSENMMAAWQRSGSRLDTELSPGMPTGDLLYPDTSLTGELPVLSSEKFDNIGYVIFRQNYNNVDYEDYFIYRSSANYEHNHYDQGSFSIYSDSTPLVIDPASGGYYDGGPYWYNSSRAHNMVKFIDVNGNIKDGPVSSTIVDFYTSDTIDYVQSDIPDVMATYYHRHVYFVKDGFDAYVVWDDIDSENRSEIGYSTLSTSTDIAGAKATAHGYNDMDMDITFLSPENPTINKSVGGISVNSGYLQTRSVEHLTVDANASDDHLTVLYPKKNTAASLENYLLNDDSTDAFAYKITKIDGSSFVILINKGSAQSVGVTINAALTDMRTGTVYGNNNGVTTVNIGARSIMILN